MKSCVFLIAFVFLASWHSNAQCFNDDSFWISADASPFSNYKERFVKVESGIFIGESYSAITFCYNYIRIPYYVHPESFIGNSHWGGIGYLYSFRWHYSPVSLNCKFNLLGGRECFSNSNEKKPYFMISPSFQPEYRTYSVGIYIEIGVSYKVCDNSSNNGLINASIGLKLYI